MALPPERGGAGTAVSQPPGRLGPQRSSLPPATTATEGRRGPGAPPCSAVRPVTAVLLELSLEAGIAEDGMKHLQSSHFL